MINGLFEVWRSAGIQTDPAAGTAEYVLCLPDSYIALPGLLPALKKALVQQKADLVYTDGDNDCRLAVPAYIKPDFSPDLLRSRNYIGSCYAFRKELAREAGITPHMGDHERLLRLTEKACRVVHIPRVLYRGTEAPEPAEQCVRAVQEHLDRTGINGQAMPGRHPGSCRISYGIHGDPLISIVIPNRDSAEDLRRCVDSVREKTTWKNWEIVLVENNSTGSEINRYYAQLLADPRIRLVTYPRSFNYAGVINYGVRCCRGNYILQLNNDTQVITPGWLQEMLMLAQRPDTGAVGAMLY